MKQSLLTVIIIMTALLLTSCKNDIAITEKQQPGYQELLDKYNAEAVFDYVRYESGYSVVVFEDLSEVAVSMLEFRVHDCTKDESKEVSPSNGQWKVGTSLTGIKVLDADIPDGEAEPVYVYFDSKTLHMYISNGKILTFKHVERQPSEEEVIARMQNIPVVRIHTENNAPILDKENYVKGTISIIDSEKIYTNEQLIDAVMGIRGRGNSTWGMKKKPWRVKLDEKASVLGMPASKDWALLANYTDRTLIRNIVAMKLSEICGFSWTPRMRSVEVYLNDEYQGVYTLCEHKKVAAQRVDIDIVGEEDNEGEAVTGGYYLEMEDNMDETTVWRTRLNIPMMFSDPEVPTPQQLEYVKKYIDDFELAIMNSDLEDPEHGYGRFMDVKSFVDNYIIQELTKNPDGNTRKSTFLTKERGKKLEMYHIWDFDITLGNRGFEGGTGAGPENWLIRYCSGWYTPMLNDPKFEAKVKERWKELKPEFEKVVDFIDQQALYLDKAQKHNFEKWDIVNDVVDWVNMPSKGSYEAEVKYLREWYAARVQWMDKELSK